MAPEGSRVGLAGQSAVSLLASLCLCVASAAAQGSQTDLAQARELGREGLSALDRGDFATAAERLTRAIALHDVPTLRIARARARRGGGHLLSAGEDYRVVLGWPQTAGEPSVFATARHEARLELDALERLIPRLTLVLNGGPATIKVGGGDWPESALGAARAIDPGDYVVEVVAKTGQVARQRVRVEQGKDQTLTLTAPVPAPAAAATSVLPAPMAAESAPAAQASALPGLGVAAQAQPDRPRDAPGNHTAGYVVGGVAVALAVGAIITSVLYFQYRGDYDDRNVSTEPKATKTRLRNKARDMGLIASAMTGGALIGGGVSVYLLLSTPDRHVGEHAQAAIRSGGIDRTELGFVGRF